MSSIKYRILHIPTGEWVCHKDILDRPKALEFRFKWLAKYFLRRHISDTTYLAAGENGYMTSFLREEFEVVATNSDLLFGNRSNVPAVSRAAKKVA